MNKITKETFTRSDIELSLKKQFPNLNKTEISEALNIALNDVKLKNKIKNITNVYGGGDSAKQINRVLESISINNKLLRKKITYWFMFFQKKIGGSFKLPFNIFTKRKKVTLNKDVN